MRAVKQRVNVGKWSTYGARNAIKVRFKIKTSKVTFMSPALYEGHQLITR